MVKSPTFDARSGILKRMRLRHLVSLAPIVAPMICLAQTQPQQQTPTQTPEGTLTLEQALLLARDRNGLVQSQYLQVQAARQGVRAAQGAFFPTVTPRLSYSDQRTDVRTGISANGAAGGTGTRINSGVTTEVVADWQILDAGQRNFNLQQQRRGFEAEEFTARQTLRQTLFTVDQQYFNTLRSQELERVASAQVERANSILQQTNVQVQVGDAPRKDILQAQADLLNAKVQQLQTQTQTSTNTADLKATIGWDPNQALPKLVAPAEPTSFQLPGTLPELIAEGLKQRPDLQAERKRIEAQHLSYLLARLRTGFTYSLDAQFTATFSPDVVQNRLLSFLISYPLFDGGVLQAEAKQLYLQEQASRAALTQDERQAAAEIESAFHALDLDAQRVSAAKAAVTAAQENYRAAAEAQRLGAQGSSIITVLTAQVSLVTAESDYIQAIYDYYIAEAQLNLVTGRQLPGEPARLP